MNILKQYESKINGTLNTFDRMIINGYILSLQNPRLFLYYLNQNDIKLVDFHDFAQKQTEELCQCIEDFASTYKVHIQYLPAKTDKDALAREALELNPEKYGLIAAFSAVELCRTMAVKYMKDTGHLYPESRYTKCKHYYLYFNDEEFGWMFFKIQTWFPYNVQIYINGHEYLAKRLDKEGMQYEMFHNSFAYLDDFPKAQELADTMLSKKISDSFDGLANKLNPHLPNIKEKLNHSYYWCIDQCEFATDINFKTREDLSSIYKKLVETTYFTFSSEDIYSFFGRKISYIQHLRSGDIISDLRKRYQGYRIKFKIDHNQVKMYDKGNNLRIEVTINNPRDFKILKTVEDYSTGEVTNTKKWKPMGKSIANLYRYADISDSIIQRFINALPEIDTDQLCLSSLNKISQRIEVNGRIYSALNLLNVETLQLMNEISKGKYLINGFTNKDIRNVIFDDAETASNINRMTRLLSKLKAHGVIKRVARKNKYYLTEKGRKMTSSLLLYSNGILL